MQAGRITQIDEPYNSAVLEILRNALELHPPLADAKAIPTLEGYRRLLADREPVLGPSMAQPGFREHSIAQRTWGRLSERVRKAAVLIPSRQQVGYYRPSLDI